MYPTPAILSEPISIRPKAGSRPTASSGGLFGRFHQEHWPSRCLPDHVACPAVSDECRATARTADRRRNPDQPHPQHRHDRSAHPPRRRHCAAGGCAARSREAEYFHHDLTVILSSMAKVFGVSPESLLRGMRNRRIRAPRLRSLRSLKAQRSKSRKLQA